MTDLANSECVITDGIMLCSLPSFGVVYTVNCSVNEERFTCNHVIMCFQLFYAFVGKAIYSV